MTDNKNDWEQIVDDLNALALKLQMHFKAAADDEADAARDALQGLRDTMDRAFAAIGRAAKDEAIREDVRRVGTSLGDALANTFSEVGAELSKALKSTGS